MLKDKEPVKKELYHITYLRMQAQEQKEKERLKRKAEERRLTLEKAEMEAQRGRTLSNIPPPVAAVRHSGSSPEAIVTDLNINNSAAASRTQGGWEASASAVMDPSMSHPAMIIRTNSQISDKVGGQSEFHPNTDMTNEYDNMYAMAGVTQASFENK